MKLNISALLITLAAAKADVDQVRMIYPSIVSGNDDNGFLT